MIGTQAGGVDRVETEAYVRTTSKTGLVPTTQFIPTYQKHSYKFARTHAHNKDPLEVLSRSSKTEQLFVTSGNPENWRLPCSKVYFTRVTVAYVRKWKAIIVNRDHDVSEDKSYWSPFRRRLVKCAKTRSKNNISGFPDNKTYPVYMLLHLLRIPVDRNFSDWVAP